ALLLVERDPRTPALGRDRLLRDRLLEGRVLAAVVAAQDESGVPRLRLERLHLLYEEIPFRHGTIVPMRRALENGYELDDDRDRLDRDAIHAYLGGTSYWAKGRTRERQDELIDASERVVGLYA